MVVFFTASCNSRSILPTQTPTIMLKPSLLPTTKITSTSKLTPIITNPPIPTLQPAATLTPGPGIAFWYIKNGSIYRYSFQSWASEEISILSKGQIVQATFSPNRQYLAYRDDEGVKLSQRPFDKYILIATSKPGWGNGLAYSPNDRFLAYNDGEGLKLYDLNTHENWLLVSHEINKSGEVSYNRYFSPDHWSPDGQWLTVLKLFYEGTSTLLFNIPNKTAYPFTNCNSEIAWLPGSPKMAVSVTYSGMQACGEEDGIFLVSATVGRVSEKRVFSNNIPSDPLNRETRYLELSHSGQWISFVQVTYPYSETVSQLMIIRNDGSDPLELVNTRGSIETPIWSKTDNKIYYIEDQRLCSVDVSTLEKRDYSFMPYDSEAVSLSPDWNWIVIGNERMGTFSLWFINMNTGDVISAEKESEYIIGWE
jgi:Tol biopolymer transport system component